MKYSNPITKRMKRNMMRKKRKMIWSSKK